MKKFLAIALSALFVFGLAASAFAIHAEIPAETTPAMATGTTTVQIGGNVRTRGFVGENLTNLDDNIDDTKAYYDQRTRLNVTAYVSDTAMGYISLENAYKWGDTIPAGASGIYGSGNIPGVGPAGGGGNVKEGTTQILESWIKWTPGPVGVKIGHMPLALGNKLFFDHSLNGDDAIVIFADPMEGLHIAALTIKFEDGQAAESTDQNGYVILGAYSSDLFNASADLTNVRSGSASSFFAAKMNFMNMGVRADAKIGPVKVYADFEKQFGTAFTDTPAETDFDGVATMLGASAKLGMVDLGAEFGVGSGQDTSNDITVFVTSLNGASPYYGFVYERVSVNKLAFQGISNLTYFRVNAGASLTDALKLKGSLLQLMATEDNAAGENAIGMEFDVNASYQLSRNLQYFIEGGVLIADDYFGANPDNAYAFRHGVQLSF